MGFITIFFFYFLDAEHFALLQKEKMDHLLSGLNINDNLFYVTNIQFLNFLTESSSRATTIIETVKTEISRTVSTSTGIIRRETGINLSNNITQF